MLIGNSREGVRGLWLQHIAQHDHQFKDAVSKVLGQAEAFARQSFGKTHPGRETETLAAAIAISLLGILSLSYFIRQAVSIGWNRGINAPMYGGDALLTAYLAVVGFQFFILLPIIGPKLKW